tara:strand:- start:3359 stop:3892 length:534 start_codon:yes stop_codon:yes gene_type:complete
MRRYNKQEILSSVSILDVAEKSSIDLEEISSGNFTHRCKCPSKEHKGGTERTGSLYIDGDNNNFYCFGCGASNNTIDFYMICNDVDFSEAILAMSKLVDPDKVKLQKPEVKATTFGILLGISKMFRDAIRSHPDKLVEIESVMRRTDEYLSDIGRYDTKKAKALSKKIRAVLNRRVK